MNVIGHERVGPQVEHLAVAAFPQRIPNDLSDSRLAEVGGSVSG